MSDTRAASKKRNPAHPNTMNEKEIENALLEAVWRAINRAQSHGMNIVDSTRVGAAYLDGITNTVSYLIEEDGGVTPQMIQRAAERTAATLGWHKAKKGGD